MSMIPLTNDEKLLEAAAKAAGIDLRWLNGGPLGRGPMGPHVVSPFGNANYWNPLENYGDELQLAEELGISIDFADCCAWKRLPGGRLIQEFWGGDFDPRHGHAVLRAAAALAGTGGA